MTNLRHDKAPSGDKTVRKPFLKGAAADERTVRSSLIFFGTLLLVYFISFIACATASFSSFVLKLLMNAAVVILGLIIFFNNGSKRGAEDVSKGEILWQKQESGRSFSETERKLCYHHMKGYLIGVAGTLPFLIFAVCLALKTSVPMTGSGTLPSWMQAYVKRGDIGNALINYTQPEGMKALDYIRAVIRLAIIPFVNIVGTDHKTGILILERLSPLILLLPAASYGTGYVCGRQIRTKIHTAISENDRRRVRREKKRRNARSQQTSGRGPEQLN